MNAPMNFFTNDTERVRITSDGKVGIGTPSPSEKLTINAGGWNSSNVAAVGGLRINSSGNVGDGIGFTTQNNNGYIYYGGNASWIGEASLGFVTNHTNSPSNVKMVIKNSGNVGIGTTSPTYKLTVGNGSATNYSLISIYAEGNVSAGGYITRTSIYDKSKGSALNYVKDAPEYLIDGKIDHTKFYGYTTWNTTEQDLSKPIVSKEDVEECSTQEVQATNLFGVEQFDNEGNPIMEEKEVCTTKEVETITYPDKQVKNEGVLLDQEIDVLRQSIYELKLENNNLTIDIAQLKQENTAMKKSLCDLGAKEWC